MSKNDALAKPTSMSLQTLTVLALGWICGPACPSLAFAKARLKGDAGVFSMTVSGEHSLLVSPHSIVVHNVSALQTREEVYARFGMPELEKAFRFPHFFRRWRDWQARGGQLSLTPSTGQIFEDGEPVWLVRTNGMTIEVNGDYVANRRRKGHPFPHEDVAGQIAHELTEQQQERLVPSVLEESPDGTGMRMKPWSTLARELNKTERKPEVHAMFDELLTRYGLFVERLGEAGTHQAILSEDFGVLGRDLTTTRYIASLAVMTLGNPVKDAALRDLLLRQIEHEGFDLEENAGMLAVLAAMRPVHSEAMMMWITRLLERNSRKVLFLQAVRLAAQNHDQSSDPMRPEEAARILYERLIVPEIRRVEAEISPQQTEQILAALWGKLNSPP